MKVCAKYTPYPEPFNLCSRFKLVAGQSTGKG